MVSRHDFLPNLDNPIFVTDITRSDILECWMCVYVLLLAITLVALSEQIENDIHILMYRIQTQQIQLMQSLSFLQFNHAKYITIY